MSWFIVLRQMLLFTHLAAFALAVVTILREDLALFQVRRVKPEQMARTGRLTIGLLAVLWVTGAILLYMIIGPHPAKLLAMPKLVMKISVVILLSINGVILHTVAFPMLTRPQQHPQRAALLCAMTGAISAVSWIYAALLGAARYMAPKMDFTEFLVLYLLSLGVAMIIAFRVARPQVEKLILPIKNERDGRSDRRYFDRREGPRRELEIQRLAGDDAEPAEVGYETAPPSPPH